MDSAWGKENPESGRIVRFVSFEYFYSGQFVRNCSISRPSYLVCFIYLALYKVSIGRGIHCCGTSLGSLWPLQQLWEELSHLSLTPVRDSCHRLLSWTFILCSKGKQSTDQYFLCVFHLDKFNRRRGKFYRE